MRTAYLRRHCDEVLVAINSPDCRRMGLAALDLLDQEIRQVVELAQRQRADCRQALDAMRYHFATLRHAVAELRTCLERDELTSEERLTARIFAEYLLQFLPSTLDFWGDAPAEPEDLE